MTHRPLVIVLALAGVALTVVSAIMPWLTLAFPLGSFSFNLIDYLYLVDFSTGSAGNALQTIQSSLSIQDNFTPGSVIVKTTVFLLLLTLVFFAITIGTAVVSLAYNNQLVFPGAFAIATALTGTLGVETLKAYVSSQAQNPILSRGRESPQKEFHPH
jgi:hypothetical protein